MSETKPNGNLHEPQRQSMLGVVVYILRNFRIMFTLFISLVAVSISNLDIGMVVGFGLVPAAILFTVLAYYQHRNFTFHVEGDELIIHKGVFFKDRLEVKVDRIQSINITENLVQRLLGLVALKVDTAGSKGSELEIPALDRKIANALKQLLYKKKEGVYDAESADTDVDAAPIAEESGKILVRLSVWDLIKVGLTENHLKTGFVAIAFVMGTVSQYQDFITEKFDDSIDEYTLQAVNAGVKVVLVFIVLYTLLSIVMSIVGTFLRFYDLKAVLKSDTIDISTGLFKKLHFRIPITKVQYIEWSSNPLRKAVGFESAKLKTSNSAGEAQKQQRIEIPALKVDKSQMLADGIFTDYVPPQPKVNINAMAYARFVGIITGILFLALTGLAYWKLQWYAGIPFGLWVILIGVGYFYGKSVQLNFSDDFILIKKGFIFKSRVVIPTFKVQAVSLEENIFLKRRKLNHMKIYTAAGSKRVKYLSKKDAEALYDHVLMCVERSSKPWM